MHGPQGARTEGHRLKLLDAVVDAVDSDATAGLGLIVRDLARALEAEIVLLAVPDEARENVEVLAAWGAVASHDGLPISLEADGFVGRALTFGRAAVEPIDSRADCLGQPTSGARITHALGAPVKPLIGPSGVMCAAFSTDPSHDLTTTLWLAESYARLASLCLQDREALEGLLSGGRIDGLTGCLTQAAFLQELSREIARSARHDRPLSCSFIDIDHFKRVNDRYGHLHGSRVLASIAAVLRAGIRSEDTVGRYGGDEFVLLLPDTDEAAAVELSERLRSTITTTMINLPHDPIDASIGVAQWRSCSPVNALLAAADEALLAAKVTGGGTTISASALTPPNAPENPGQHASERGARLLAETSEMASVKDVLDVSAHFDESGGASVELTAWELDIELALVVSAWSRAIKDGFLEPAGTDPDSGEEMWRLSEWGRHARDTSPVV
jgi:diguanylate cyclase (GGDEF)-like protein